MDFKLTYKPYGERSVLIEWPAVIKENILHDLLHFKDVVLSKNIKQLVEIKHTYNSLLIIYEHINSNFNNKISTLKTLYLTRSNAIKPPSRLWKIPVCYDTSFGLDLEEISIINKIAIKDIITLHTGAIYTVYFIGFLPGFLYLGGLDNRLSISRKPTPRLNIEKGAVAIGGNQTGVYPSQSPGGWQIIGNSPISFFNPKDEIPCFANAGDKIMFYPITMNKHNDIKTLVNAGVYQLKSEAIDG